MDSTRSDARLVPPHRLWARTSWLLSHAAGRAYRLVVQQAGGAAARTRYGFLAALEEFGPISQAELGRRLGIDPKEVVGVLRDLERDALISRAPDPRDPRRNAVDITPAGRRALKQLDRALDIAHRELLAPLSAAERRQLDQLLQRLVEHHFGAPQRPGPERSE